MILKNVYVKILLSTKIQPGHYIKCKFLLLIIYIAVKNSFIIKYSFYDEYFDENTFEN